jgi:hypothetical protein
MRLGVFGCSVFLGSLRITPLSYFISSFVEPPRTRGDVARFRPVAQQPATNPLSEEKAVAKSGCFFSENGNRDPQRAPRDQIPHFALRKGASPFERKSS